MGSCPSGWERFKAVPATPSSRAAVQEGQCVGSQEGHADLTSVRDVEACRVVRHRGSHISQPVGSQMGARMSA
jgi:hypothetical protein